MEEKGENDEKDEKEKEKSLKLVLIGNMGVGKTSILTKYCDDKFNENIISTSGIEFKTKTIHKNGYKVKMQIWDTSGQERFRSITPNYFRSSDALLFVFDVTNEESFKVIKDFINLSEGCSHKNLIKILIGNKIDQEEKRLIQKDDIATFAQQYNFNKYFEASAKKGDKINDIFELIADLSTKEGSEDETLNSENSEKKQLIVQNANKANKNNNICCC